MPLPLTVALLALWSLAMARYGRSILFPPAALAMVWTITLLVIWLSGDMYFPLTGVADAIVLAGVLAFSLGGIGAVAAPVSKAPTLANVSSRRRIQVDRWLKPRTALSDPEYPPLLPLLQAAERNHRSTRERVEADSHRVREGKYLRSGYPAD
jgi:hypothetical protein